MCDISKINANSERLWVLWQRKFFLSRDRLLSEINLALRVYLVLIISSQTWALRLAYNRDI